MDPSFIWLAAGLILIALELVIPGLIVIFLGVAALIVAAALSLGLVTGWISALTLWFVASLGLVTGVRSAFTRFLPGGAEKGSTNEDLDAFGEWVEVVDEVGPEGGRVRFRGSTWAAQTVDGKLSPGTKARIVARDNLVWIVEPADEWPALDDPQRSQRKLKEGS